MSRRPSAPPYGVKRSAVHLDGTTNQSPNVRGKLVGSFPGAAAGSASLAILRGKSGEVLGERTVGARGEFVLSNLPERIRGETCSLDLAVTDPVGSIKVLRTVQITVPLTGDAAVVLDRGKFGSAIGSLAPTAELLDASRLSELISESAVSSQAFAAARKKRSVPTSANLIKAADYLFTLSAQTSDKGLAIRPSDLPAFDLNDIFLKPALGLTGRPVPRKAKLRLTRDEAARIEAGVPTLCRVIEARGDQRVFERRPSLRNRLRVSVRVNSLVIPPPDPLTPAPGSPPNTPTASITQLEAAAERAVLRSAAGLISDVGPKLCEPSTETDLRRLHELVADLELAGPANVAAAREVHSLQIAFKPAWTPLFDNAILGTLARLDELLSLLRKERGIPVSSLPLGIKREQLKTYVASTKRLIAASSSEPLPQIVRIKYPRLTAHQWASLNDEARDLVVRKSAQNAGAGSAKWQTMEWGSIVSGTVGTFVDTAGDLVGVGGADGTSGVRNYAEGVRDHTEEGVRDHRGNGGGGAHNEESEIEELLRSSPSAIGEADQVLDELNSRLDGTYEFTIFPPGSVNYGLLLTYRQEWSPVTYQVGRLIDTIPLTPGERREFKLVTTRKKRENRKSVTTESRDSRREMSSTRRLEAEAIEAATMALNNQVSANGNFDIGVGSIGGSTEFSSNQASESRRTLKNFSEMAQKAVDSLREQVEVTIESTDEWNAEESEVRTLVNPNNEITLTYLLYELERRYRVSTQLQRVRPVVTVALPMPSPGEITPAWILEYSWQIRDALLDATLLETLDRLEEYQSAAAVEHDVRRAALLEQRRLSQQLVTEYEGLEAAARKRRDLIVGLTEGEGLAEAGEAGTGERVAAAVLTAGASELFGWGSSDTDERMAAQRETAEKALEYLERQIELKGGAITSAAAAVKEAVDEFTETAVKRRRSQLATARLQVHIRDNIFHYMHAIWASTHPDNRFFELYNRRVPFHTPRAADYNLQPFAGNSVLPQLPGIDDGGTDYELAVKAPDVTQVPPRRRLADIADLDRPLGFRGNSVVFELRQCSQLTDHMAAQYIDRITGVASPGSLSGVTTDELLDYLEEAIRQKLLSAQQLVDLKVLALRLYREQQNWSDELVLPTGQLFLEGLKGATSLLEPFKLVHRGLDVLSAEEEVRARRIDSLRRVRKVAQSDLERDPTSVEHFYLGETPNVVATEVAPAAPTQATGDNSAPQ